MKALIPMVLVAALAGCAELQSIGDPYQPVDVIVGEAVSASRPPPNPYICLPKKIS